MKNLITLSSILAALASNCLFADNVCQDKLGTLKCGIGTVNNITYSGFVETDGTTVANAVDVLGNVNLVNSHLNTLHVKGDAHLTKTDIAGTMNMLGRVNTNEVQINNSTKVVGDFYANHTRFMNAASIVGMIDCDFCTFQSETTVTGDMTTESSEFISSLTLNIKKATFSNTKLVDVLVKKPNEDEEQTIYLKNGSRVHNITFDNQKGTVILSDNSQITGNVQGGKIIKN